jgi:hypothetical protein
MSGDLAKPSFSTMDMVLSLSSAFPGCLNQPPSVSRQRRRACFLGMYVYMMIITIAVVVCRSNLSKYKLCCVGPTSAAHLMYWIHFTENQSFMRATIIKNAFTSPVAYQEKVVDQLRYRDDAKTRRHPSTVYGKYSVANQFPKSRIHCPCVNAYVLLHL